MGRESFRALVIALAERNAKEAFIRNCYSYDGGKTFRGNFNSIYIASSFPWCLSNEGSDFWGDMWNTYSSHYELLKRSCDG